MKYLNRLSLVFLIVAMAFSFVPANIVQADKIIEETVVTLGADLSPDQKAAILQEMDVANDVKTLEVTNKEEHQYLGNYMDKDTIGTRAISSAKIVLSGNSDGISVQTKNITHITEAMYANAAITAGIKDADIYITAPFQVSGTGALTGIIKAFEEATGEKIDEDQKQVANEEIVRTQELAQEIGDEETAVQFMNKVKEEISKQKPETEEEYRDIIVNVSNEYNINLSNETINHLVSFSQNFSSLNIDWTALSDQFDKLRGDLGGIINSEQTQGIIDNILAWFGELFSSIGGFFSSSSSEETTSP